MSVKTCCWVGQVESFYYRGTVFTFLIHTDASTGFCDWFIYHPPDAECDDVMAILLFWWRRAQKVLYTSSRQASTWNRISRSQLLKIRCSTLRNRFAILTGLRQILLPGKCTQHASRTQSARRCIGRPDLPLFSVRNGRRNDVWKREGGREGWERMCVRIVEFIRGFLTHCTHTQSPLSRRRYQFDECCNRWSTQMAFYIYCFFYKKISLALPCKVAGYSLPIHALFWRAQFIWRHDLH